MKRNLFSLMFLPLFLSGCYNIEHQIICDDVSRVGGICLRQYGSLGREPFEVNRTNVIYEPTGRGDRTIMILAINFLYSDNKTILNIAWEFSDPSLVNIIMPSSKRDNLAIVDFIKYPASPNEVIPFTLDATISLGKASSRATYNFELRTAD